MSNTTSLNAELNAASLYRAVSAGFASRGAGQVRALRLALGGLAGTLVVAALRQAWPGAELLAWLLMAPLCEELFFRGVLHEALLHGLGRHGGLRRESGGAANVAVACAFAGLHAWTRGPWTGMAVLLPALCIGYAYQRERSVWQAALLHASFNLAWLAWSLALARLPQGWARGWLPSVFHNPVHQIL